MVDHLVPENNCINCGSLYNSVTTVDADDRPIPGDITICVKCGYVMKFGKKLKLEELDDNDKREVKCDLQIQNITGMIKRGLQ